MEIWDLYTKDRQPTGREHVRGEPLPAGYYYLGINAWIRNSRGEYLISQRSANKATYPLKWECVGGAVQKGEDSLTGALREIREEVGLKLSKEGAVLIRTAVLEDQSIEDVWLFHYDGPVELKNATTDEVAQCRWMNVEEIRALWEAGEMVDSQGYFFTELELG